MTASVARIQSIVYLIDLVKVASLAARWVISHVNASRVQAAMVLLVSGRQFEGISSTVAQQKQIRGLREGPQEQQAQTQREE